MAILEFSILSSHLPSHTSSKLIAVILRRPFKRFHYASLASYPLEGYDVEVEI